MGRHYFVGLALLAAVLVVGVSSRPSHNESTPPVTDEKEVKETEISKGERSLIYNEERGADEDNISAREILDKIRIINDGLETPIKRQPINHNTQPHTGGGYVIDNEILEKIQQIIAAGKLNPLSLNHKHQLSNSLNNEDLGGPRYSRNLPYASTQFPVGISQDMAVTPYIMNIPVMVMPMINNMLTPNANANAFSTMNTGYQTRQRPSLPFNIPWPLAPFFPILIKDPLLSFLGGGNWNNLVDFGQSADVCNRNLKSVDKNQITEDTNNNMQFIDEGNSGAMIQNLRQARALKKRQIQTKTLEDNIETLNKVKKVLVSKATAKKPVKQSHVEEAEQTKTGSSDEGDLRFPFADFTWFGNKKPVVPSPGFFINKLKVRKGGVAIAGPGGVATAGRGGTAIVGPGGLAYTQPGGLAVAGPAARIIALSSDSDLSSIVSRLQEQSENSSVPRSISQLIDAVPEGKLVATGPIIFYHPKEQTFFRGGWRRNSAHSKGSDEYRYNGAGFVKGPWMAKDAFTLYLKPVAHANSSPRGVAVANPISNVVVSRNDVGSIIHTPVASAIVGPHGIAHAQSDLYLASVQYLPFYGGAKGQYLEIKKDNSGSVTSEKIVPEEKISSENIIKNSNENLLSKVLAANLQSLRSTSLNLLKLHNLGRRVGFLSNSEKARFKEQLSSLEETASNTVKIIDDIGGDIDMLFRTNATKRRYEDYDYVEDAGVGIEAPTDGEPIIPLEGATIAEAKPVGLAIIGENGLAASRPVATAIASHGVALARPIATAVAGVDPTKLGLQYQIDHTKH